MRDEPAAEKCYSRKVKSKRQKSKRNMQLFFCLFTFYFSWPRKHNRLRSYDAFAFLNRDRLICAHVRQRLHAAGWPCDFHAGDFFGLAQPKCHRQLALGSIARSALHHAPEFLIAGLHNDLRSYAVAIGSRANRLDPEQVVLIASVVSQQSRGTIVGRDQQIEVAIIIEVAISCSPRDDGLLQSLAQFRRYLIELLLAEIAKEVRRLRVLHFGLHRADVIGHVAIGGKNVRQPVEIIIKKETGERQR